MLLDRKCGQKFAPYTPPPPFNKKHSWSNRVPHHLGMLGRGSKMNNNQCRFTTLWDLTWVFQLTLFILSLWLCVFGAVRRYELLQKQLFQLEEAEGGFDQFTRSYRSFGVQRLPDNSLFFKEWAPAAEALFLTGDFSKWHLQMWLKPRLLPVLVSPVPFSLSVLKIEPKNSHWAVSHVSKLLQLRRNDRFNDAVTLCVCDDTAVGRICARGKVGARQRGVWGGWGWGGSVPCQGKNATVLLKGYLDNIVCMLWYRLILSFYETWRHWKYWS